ncbi:MAG: DUF4157 domain-containing protein [Flavobacteriaceae bacterium]|nr:DUF4157 domain-containing protein [Flavobacteriaceae bacterium]
MNTHADKTQENKSQSVSVADSQVQSGGELNFQFVDNRPEAIAQRKLQEMANNRPQAQQATQLQSIADNHFTEQKKPLQKKENNTGLPDNLKTGIENLSGMSLDDVKVHRNSDKPAQLQAHAYAQGTDIHLGPGQEKHLPHEAWHVVQQKQGRVKPTMQMKGKINVNDDEGLEKEADKMGAAALSTSAYNGGQDGPIVTLQRSITPVVQRAGHAEDLCILADWIIKRTDVIEINQYVNSEVPGVAPNYRGPFYTLGTLRAVLEEKGIALSLAQQLKVQTMSEDIAHGGRGFMLLENATSGMAAPALRDLKLGKHSASGTDQERHGISGISKGLKIFRHNIMDFASGSASRGFRDEDRWKSSKIGDNLDALNAMLGTAGPVGLLRVRVNLQELWEWAHASNVVYVGMSVLVVVDPPPNDSGKAVAIDFEHPIRDSDASFETHKAGLLEGIMNIKNIVNTYI